MAFQKSMLLIFCVVVCCCFDSGTSRRASMMWLPHSKLFATSILCKLDCFLCVWSHIVIILPTCSFLYSYPDATIEELEAVSNVCIICREEMVSRCKKLPCGHIFHTACLQSWFQRQQTCPTCRMDVLNRTVVNRLMQGQGQGQPQNPRHQQVPPEPQPFNPQQNNGEF